MSFPAAPLPAASFPATISAAAVDMVVGFLLPLLLPACGGDSRAATDLALQLLGDFKPRTAWELTLAAEAIGHSLKSLAMLAKSAEPELAAEAQEASLKRACSLARSSHQVQRRLDALRRPERGARRSLNPAPDAATPPDAPVVQDVAPEPAAAAPPSVAPEVQTDVAQLEAALKTGEKLLALMKARHKGALAPYSKAAQDIRHQERAVQAARLKLQQARTRQATTAPQHDAATAAT